MSGFSGRPSIPVTRRSQRAGAAGERRNAACRQGKAARARTAIGVVLAAAVACGLGVLWACGPEFPTQLLETRDEVLLQAPEVSFREAVRRLVPVPPDADVLKPVEHEAQAWEEADAEDTRAADMAAAEAEDLPADAAPRIQAMRALDDATAAFGAGEGLPLDVRRYTAGAVGFHHDQADAARAYFESVVALPEDQRRRRGVWARFMLGRLAAARGDVATAAAHFEATRALVRSGARDRLGLAVGSLGEEARLHLKPGAIAHAVLLYAQQAAYGSTSGTLSLAHVASRILFDEQLLDEAVQDDLARRLVILFVQASGPEWYDARVAEARAEDERFSPERLDPKNWLERLLGALERNRISDATGSGFLAAVAYKTGRFDTAERLAMREATPVASWVLAKLAWRRGDTASALAHYRKALTALRGADPAGRAINQLAAEMGVLHVGRDEFVQALDLFYAAAAGEWRSDTSSDSADFWWDAAYLAERVLTLDELRQYVDQHVKAPSATEVDEAAERGGTLPAVALRSLLARRLMRGGRHADAIPYFDVEAVRAVAEEYQATMKRASSRWRGQMTRAEAWYAAATIARFDGMELMGLELSPDYAVVGGRFSLDDEEIDDYASPGEDADPEQRVPGNLVADERDRATATAQDVPKQILPTESERKRLEGSAPTPNSRFHYRVTAVDHAMKAADLLPSSSQAFAAVLCIANGWIADREPERAAAVYARYLREGPYVRWARSFGRRCPQPDFDGARRRVWAARVEGAAGVVRLHPIAVGLAGCVLLGGAVVSARTTVRRYRRR